MGSLRRRKLPSYLCRARRLGSRPPVRKTNELGFGARTAGLKKEESGPAGGRVRARQSGKPMNSVSEREPRAGKKDDGGPAAGRVRARQSGKPMNSVFEREPRAGKKDDGGPAAGRVRARQSGKPMNSVFEREPRT